MLIVVKHSTKLINYLAGTIYSNFVVKFHDDLLVMILLVSLSPRQTSVWMIDSVNDYRNLKFTSISAQAQKNYQK